MNKKIFEYDFFNAVVNGVLVGTVRKSTFVFFDKDSDFIKVDLYVNKIGFTYFHELAERFPEENFEIILSDKKAAYVTKNASIVSLSHKVCEIKIRRNVEIKGGEGFSKKINDLGFFEKAF